MASPRAPRVSVTDADPSPAPAVPMGKAGDSRVSGQSTNGQPDPDPGGAPAAKRVLRSQGRRTMRKLLDAAMIAFDKRGYHATRVNDVVEIAKTSHGTFYLYFSNKEDVLRALVAEAAAEAQQLYDTLNDPGLAGTTPSWEDVHGWVRAYSDLWTRYAPLFRSWTDLASIDSDLVDAIRDTFIGMADALATRIDPDGTGHPVEGGGAGHTVERGAAGMATLAMLDRFHYLREFVGQPVDEVAIDTLTTMLYRALFEAGS